MKNLLSILIILSLFACNKDNIAPSSESKQTETSANARQAKSLFTVSNETDVYGYKGVLVYVPQICEYSPYCCAMVTINCVSGVNKGKTTIFPTTHSTLGGDFIVKGVNIRTGGALFFGGYTSGDVLSIFIQPQNDMYGALGSPSSTVTFSVQ